MKWLLLNSIPLPAGLIVVEWDVERSGSARYRLCNPRAATRVTNIAMFPFNSESGRQPLCMIGVPREDSVEIKGQNLNLNISIYPIYYLIGHTLTEWLGLWICLRYWKGKEWHKLCKYRPRCEYIHKLKHHKNNERSYCWGGWVSWSTVMWNMGPPGRLTVNHLVSSVLCKFRRVKH